MKCARARATSHLLSNHMGDMFSACWLCFDLTCSAQWERKSLAAALRYSMDSSERNSLYSEWGVDPGSKARKLQLVAKVGGFSLVTMCIEGLPAAQDCYPPASLHTYLPHSECLSVYESHLARMDVIAKWLPC
jgi:hypothetical protein